MNFLNFFHFDQHMLSWQERATNCCRIGREKAIKCGKMYWKMLVMRGKFFQHRKTVQNIPVDFGNENCAQVNYENSKRNFPFNKINSFSFFFSFILFWQWDVNFFRISLKMNWGKIGFCRCCVRGKVYHVFYGSWFCACWGGKCLDRFMLCVFVLSYFRKFANANLSHRREQGRTFDVEIIILRSDHNKDNQ